MKYYLISMFLLCVMACGEASEETKEAPGAIDNSTQHPNGVTGGAVISTDTGAIRGDSTQVQQDSMPKEK
jgi:hypothetical protein